MYQRGITQGNDISANTKEVQSLAMIKAINKRARLFLQANSLLFTVLLYEFFK